MKDFCGLSMIEIVYHHPIFGGFFFEVDAEARWKKNSTQVTHLSV
jgi:hypothetical protein